MAAVKKRCNPYKAAAWRPKKTRTFSQIISIIYGRGGGGSVESEYFSGSRLELFAVSTVAMGDIKFLV